VLPRLPFSTTQAEHSDAMLSYVIRVGEEDRGNKAGPRQKKHKTFSKNITKAKMSGAWLN
jgi:hypothetical protein